MKQYAALFVKYLRPLLAKFSWLTILIFISIGLQLINPQIIRYFIDAVLTNKDTQFLFWAAVAFLGVSLFTQIINVAATYVGEDVAWRATNQLRADLMQHCTRLDMSFHNAHTPGELIERIDGDVLKMANFFSRFTINVLGNVLLLVGVLVVLAFEDWRITLMVLTYMILGIVSLGYLRQIAVPFWQAVRQSSADLFGFLEEQLAGTEDIRANGAVSYVLRNLFKFNRSYLVKELKSVTANAFIAAVLTGLYVLGQAAAFSLGFYFLRIGILTTGAVYVVVYYTHFVFLRLSRVAFQIQDLQQAAAGIKRVRILLDVKSKIKNADQPTVLPPGPLAVIFDHVTFSYDGSGTILKDVSFRVEPGKTLGLLGRTGSGKTTITRLVFRLYDPGQGAIRLGVNGKSEPGAMNTCNIRHIALDNLRRRIGLVTQNVQLFNASMRDNITLFDHSVSDAKILQALAELGLSGWCKTLPEGLDTLVSSEGGNFSAGEAQLLAFARVFLYDPNLVILDEASSRLDPVTEKRIEQAMDTLLKNRTGIIIAHHLRTVQRVDQIMIIEDGQIQELGDYATLAADPASQFYRLLQTGLEEVLR